MAHHKYIYIGCAILAIAAARCSTTGRGTNRDTPASLREDAARHLHRFNIPDLVADESAQIRESSLGVMIDFKLCPRDLSLSSCTATTTIAFAIPRSFAKDTAIPLGTAATMMNPAAPATVDSLRIRANGKPKKIDVKRYLGGRWETASSENAAHDTVLRGPIFAARISSDPLLRVESVEFPRPGNGTNSPRLCANGGSDAALYLLPPSLSMIAQVLGFVRVDDQVAIVVQDGDHVFRMSMNSVRVDAGISDCGLEVTLMLTSGQTMRCLLRGINGYDDDAPLAGLLCLDVSSGAAVAINERQIVSGTVKQSSHAVARGMEGNGGY